MQITPATLQALQNGFNAAFIQGLQAPGSDKYKQLVMDVPSTAKLENYGWMKDIPGLREWIGPRVVHNLEAIHYQIYNKSWEHTLGVDRDDIMDDNLGIYRPMFSMQGETVARHPNSLLWDTVKKGISTLAFDGQYFFDTDHVGYDAAGASITYSNRLGSGSNPWYLFDLRRSFIRPLVFQMRKAPEFVALNRPDDPNVFMEKKYLFGADARYNMGFGFYQLALRSEAALDSTSFDAAYKAMATQFRVDGSTQGVMPSHLFCGPSQRLAAFNVVLAEHLASGASNPNYKTVEVVIVEELG